MAETRRQTLNYARAGRIKSITLDGGSTANAAGGFDPEGSLIYEPTGATIEWVQILEDQTQQFFYFDENGVLQMTNNTQSVGMNPATEEAPVNLVQLIGEHKFEIFDAVADVTMTKQQIIDRAVADGVILRAISSTGAVLERAALAGDWAVKFDFDLKYLEGGNGGLGEDDRATTAEAVVTNAGAEQNMDGGGSRTFGELRTGDNRFYVENDFEQIEVLAGSVVEVTVVIASAVEGETTAVPVAPGTITVFDLNYDDGTPGGFTGGYVAWNHEDAGATGYDSTTSGITYTLVNTDAAGTPTANPALAITPDVPGVGPWSDNPLDFTSWGLTSGGTQYYYKIVASNGDESPVGSEVTF